VSPPLPIRGRLSPCVPLPPSPPVDKRTPPRQGGVGASCAIGAHRYASRLTYGEPLAVRTPDAHVRQRLSLPISFAVPPSMDSGAEAAGADLELRAAG
jgi:hypothetical protein